MYSCESRYKIIISPICKQMIKTFIRLLFVAILPINCLRLNVGSTGLLFPYTLGALAYIKTNINPSNCHLTGTSGGAWCSLLYNLENNLNHDDLWSSLMGDKSQVVHLLNRTSMENFQKRVAVTIMEKYKHTNVSNMPLSVIVTKISKGYPENVKIDKFADLEEIVTYCLCSSYIPYISGSIGYMSYNGTKYMDGVITQNKKLSGTELNINKASWNRKFKLKDRLVLNFESSKRLFDDGWNDAKTNLKYLKRSSKNFQTRITTD